MQLKDQSKGLDTYRPPQTCLNFFWTLTEGDDESRVGAAIQLVKMIQSVEKKSEREEITTYCVNRLVKGLGSGRKFARVGFSTALTLLLRTQSEVKTKQVLSCFKDKLGSERNAVSKSEKAALYLGRAFAISAIVQSGRITKIDGDVLGSIAEELLSLSGKRSFLKPVCYKAMEDLISQVPQKAFAEYVWPKIRDRLTLGWEECTLDRLSLLLVCKEKYPDIVNKKFIKKHWGPSIFSEDNDAKLLQAVKISTEKSHALKEKILPYILGSGRDALSIWKGLGDKMLWAGKDNVISQQQIISLEILSQLILLSSDSQQVLLLILDPSVTKAIFLENHTGNELMGKTLSALVGNLCEKLKSTGSDILSFVNEILKLEGITEEGAKEGKLSFIHSTNFKKIVNLMDKSEIEQYANVLVEYVKGRDNNLFFSESVQKRKKQLDWCFRQLQHATCSQDHTTPDMQRLVLTLFLRNGFFNADKKNSKVLHCDFVDKLVETKILKELCEQFVFKSLDQLSTMNTAGRGSRAQSFARYTELLSYLVHYFQSLLACPDVQFVPDWSEETHEVWNQLFKRVSTLEQVKDSSHPDTDSAFRLLYLYMTLYLLTDAQAATDLLKDIFICHDKSTIREKKRKKMEENEDPHWVEVLTEILLQLLSFQSHLARTIASTVFNKIIPHISPEAVALITQVLVSNKSEENGMFEEGGGEEEEEDENRTLLDDDVPSEESDDDDTEEEDEDDGGEEGDDSSDEEEMDVDQQMRTSVREALGDAAVEDDVEDDEDLPDLSDSEMFKFDAALAEVFRQKERKRGGKKAKVKKRRELGNFRLRVLDLLDVLIKSDRCQEFLLDLLKPLLLLMLSSNGVDEKAAYNRAQASFQQLLVKKKSKGMTESTRSDEEQRNMFQELLDLARRVEVPSQLQHIASACYLMIKVSSVDCLQSLQDTLNNVINKKQSKPLPPFFITLLDMDPVIFQPLCTTLVDCVQSEGVKKQCKQMALTLLTSLTKKTSSGPESSPVSSCSWMKQAACVVSEQIQGLDKDSVSGPVKELLTLTLGLLGRSDVLSEKHFGPGIKDKLLEIKSKMGKDRKSLITRICVALERMAEGKETLNGKKDVINGQKETVTKKQGKGKKRNTEETESPKPKKKKRRIEDE